MVARKETEVAAAALVVLAPQWAEHWPEVPSLTGRVDIVGRDAEGGIHAVECKTSASLALAVQAIDRISERAFRTVLVVCGQSDTAKAWREKTGVSDLVRVGTVAGFGVAFVRKGIFRLELPPVELVTEAGPREAVARALNDIHRECAGEAGGQSSAYWTLWKQGKHDLLEAVRAQPGIEVHALRYRLGLTKTLYWQNHGAQIRAMAEELIRAGTVTTLFEGRGYRYFPAEQTAVPVELELISEE